MAGPVHCRTVLEGSWERSREAQFEAQTRFRAVAGPKGRTPSLQRREKRGKNFKRPWTHVAERFPRERIYCDVRGGGGAGRIQMTRDDGG